MVIWLLLYGPMVLLLSTRE